MLTTDEANKNYYAENFDGIELEVLPDNRIKIEKECKEIRKVRIHLNNKIQHFELTRDSLESFKNQLNSLIL